MVKIPKQLRLLILRDFMLAGEPVPADTVLDVENPLASELVSNKKAQVTSEQPRAARKKPEKKDPADDPKALKARIAELEKQVAEGGNKPAGAPGGGQPPGGGPK